MLFLCDVLCIKITHPLWDCWNDHKNGRDAEEKGKARRISENIDVFYLSTTG